MSKIDKHDPKNGELIIKLDVPMENMAEFLRAWEEYVSHLIEFAGPVTQATLTLPPAAHIMELDHF